MKRNLILLFAFAFGSVAHAGSRSSVNYNIATDSADAGGTRMTSLNYTQDGCVGGIAGLAISSALAETVKQGYAGQLYDVTDLRLDSAGATTVNETGALQLGAWQFLDDSSLLAIEPNLVTWGVISGPVSGISPSGLVTAGTVYQDTAASVQGGFGGFVGKLNLTVLETLPDNFGSYAGDGLEDAWQVHWFGLNNPLAGPNVDPTGNGQSNLFNYIAGLDPTDVNARFVLTLELVPGQPTQKQVVFRPVVAGRTYVVKYRHDLDTAWTTLVGAVQNDAGAVRTVTDANAKEIQRFYQVEISKP